MSASVNGSDETKKARLGTDFFFGGPLGWTQCFARQVLYSLSHIASLLCSGCFGHIVSLVAQWPGLWFFYFMLSAITGITGTCTRPSFFLMRSLFSWARLEPWSSWSQPPT
jgi:hypothetical protein